MKDMWKMKVGKKEQRENQNLNRQKIIKPFTKCLFFLHFAIVICRQTDGKKFYRIDALLSKEYLQKRNQNSILNNSREIYVSFLTDRLTDIYNHKVSIKISNSN